MSVSTDTLFDRLDGWLSTNTSTRPKQRKQVSPRTQDAYNREAYNPNKIPDALQRKWDGERKLFRAMREASAKALSEARASHKTLDQLIQTLESELPNVRAHYRGVIDIDCAALVYDFSLFRLPEIPRHLALVHIGHLIDAGTQRTFGTTDDEIPWMLPEGITLSRVAAREAMDSAKRIH